MSDKEKKQHDQKKNDNTNTIAFITLNIIRIIIAFHFQFIYIASYELYTPFDMYAISLSFGIERKRLTHENYQEMKFLPFTFGILGFYFDETIK